MKCVRRGELCSPVKMRCNFAGRYDLSLRSHYISCVGAVDLGRPWGFLYFLTGRRVGTPYKMRFPIEKFCKNCLPSKPTLAVTHPNSAHILRSFQ